MVKDLKKFFMKEFQKCIMRGVCVLGRYLLNQYVPLSEFNKGFLIRNNKCYCLQMWIEYGKEIYAIGFMYNVRVFNVTTKSPQYITEEPIHLEIFDENYEKFYLVSKKFLPFILL